MKARPGRRRWAIRGVSLFGTAGALLLTAAAPAVAAGFYLQEQSVRGWGRANSGEVADQGPASLWWNPAAIGGAEESASSFGATALFPIGELSDQGSLIDRPGLPPQPVGGPSLLHDPVQNGVLPGNAFALRLSDRLALGLAITSPFSYTSVYDPLGWQRYSAIRTRLITLDVQPSIAFAPTPWLSVGAGLNVEYADAYLSNALPNLAAGSPDARLRLTGDGIDLGWSAGVQLRPSSRLSLGLAYKSAIEHNLDGNVRIEGLLGPLAARNLEADTTATFSTPWQLIVGARAGVTKSLTLNAQAVRFGWSKFDEIALGAPLSSTLAQNYKDTWSFAFGLDQKVGKRLTLRTGIQVDGTPTRDASRDPRVADADRVNFNAGLSWQLSGRLALDAAAAYTDLEAGPISRDEHFYTGTAAQIDVATRGRAARQRALVFALGGRMRL